MPPTQAKPIDLDQIVISLAAIRLEGWGTDAIATLEFEGKAFTKVAGGDGEIIRSKNFNRSGTLKCKVMQSAGVNDKLWALHKLDMNTPNGAGIGVLVIKDLQGTTLLTAASAWISAPPNPVWGTSGQQWEWSIDFASIDGNLGSN